MSVSKRNTVPVVCQDGVTRQLEMFSPEWKEAVEYQLARAKRRVNAASEADLRQVQEAARSNSRRKVWMPRIRQDGTYDTSRLALVDSHSDVYRSYLKWRIKAKFNENWDGDNKHEEAERQLMVKKARAAWQNMKDRCYNRNYQKYDNYGGRGIRVYSKWRYSFETFLLHMGLPHPWDTLKRENNNGDYTPDNCRWTTQYEQAQSRDTTLYVYSDEWEFWAPLTEVAKQVANKINEPYPRIRARLRHRAVMLCELPEDAPRGRAKDVVG